MMVVFASRILLRHILRREGALLPHPVPPISSGRAPGDGRVGRVPKHPSRDAVVGAAISTPWLPDRPCTLTVGPAI